ncbi:MAG: DinB family protein [Chloroflexi bacterium]|nr:DinB family protein [Chloroflexota bacterium]
MVDMEELLEYRQRLITKFNEAARRLENAGAASRPQEKPAGGGWNFHQVVSHLRDVNAEVYLPRLRRIQAEENPLFENFDAEAWMATHYDPDEPLPRLVEAFTQGCQETRDWLERLPPASWSRPGTHSSFGTRAFQWWVERALAHMEEHLTTLKA